MNPLLPYQGISTFLKAPVRAMDRPYGFLGVPYDAATTFRPGARLAPSAIREASKFLTDGEHPLFEVDPCALVTDLGDIGVDHVSPDAATADIMHAVESIEFAGKLVFAGGDHSVTLGIIAALATRHGATLAVVHFDAHCDTWPHHFGERRGHGTWVRDVIDDGFVEPADIISIGLRSPVAPVVRDWLGERGGTSISARDALSLEPDVMVQAIRDVVGHKPTYISFDIDALDPAFAPGTGTPEVAGLTPHWVLDVLERMGGIDLVGMDVVEVCPPFDPCAQTSLLAATLLWTFIAVDAAIPEG